LKFGKTQGQEKLMSEWKEYICNRQKNRT